MVNLYGNGVIGRVEGATLATKYYYVKDHPGSIRVTMNTAGTVISAQDYYAYGDYMRSIDNADVNSKYKFTEKERDRETNYDYFGARYYDSEIGRWLQVDPMGYKHPEWTPYNYCLNNPLKLFDPDGKFPADIHAEIITKAKGGNSFDFMIELINQTVIKDGQMANVEEMHLDNFDIVEGESELVGFIEDQGGLLNMDDHTIGDFYSHSNYVDLWDNFNKDGDKGEMPLMSSLDLNSEFGKVVNDNLETTGYPDSKKPDYPHSTSSKDTKDHPLYDAALKAYLQELQKKYQEKND